MTWLQRYRLCDYFRRSIWVLPALGMAVALGAVWNLHGIESSLGWELPFDPSTALTLLGTLASSMFTLIVFVCSALLITVQLASAGLTPRVIRLVLQSWFTKLSLTLFVFAFTFTLAALVRIKGGVPPLTAYVAAYSCLMSLGVFLYLVDRVCAALRPSGALRTVARLGREVIEDVYPRRLADPQRAPLPAAKVLDGEPRCTIPNRREGVVLAFDVEGLVALAQRVDCVIELVPQVGDFVAADQPLFRIFGDKAVPASAALYQSVAVGLERTLQQDPAFAFRIMVDIASKGCPRRSTTRPPRCWPLIRLITCSAILQAATWMRAARKTRKARYGFCTEHQPGKISCTWQSRRFVILAAQVFRSPADCAPCWKA